MAEPIGSFADMKIAGEYLHRILQIPDDVHVVGVSWEDISERGSGNVVLRLEAFSDTEFPGPNVTGRYHEHHDLYTGNRETIFDGWEATD